MYLVISYLLTYLLTFYFGSPLHLLPSAHVENVEEQEGFNTFSGSLKDDRQALEALPGTFLPHGLPGLHFLAGIFPMAVLGRWARLYSSPLSYVWPEHPWCISQLLTWSLICSFAGDAWWSLFWGGLLFS